MARQCEQNHLDIAVETRHQTMYGQGKCREGSVDAAWWAGLCVQYSGM